MYTQIKRLSKEQKLPIAKIEEMCGLSKGAIYKWDTNVPSVISVAKVADILGVTVDDLLKPDT